MSNNRFFSITIPSPNANGSRDNPLQGTIALSAVNNTGNIGRHQNENKNPSNKNVNEENFHIAPNSSANRT